MTSPLPGQGSWRTNVGRRVGGLISSLCALTDLAASTPGEGPEHTLRRELHRLRHELAEAEGRAAGVDNLSRKFEELSDLHAVAREHALAAPFQTLSRIYDALARLRRQSTVAAVLAAVPVELCEAAAFDRVMFSRVRGSTWIPEHAHIAGGGDKVNAAVADFIADLEIPLTSSLLEADLVRRRVAALVRDPREEPRAYRPLVEISRTRAYVVAPIVAGGLVVGLLHADRYLSGRALTVLDRDNLQAFADGVGLISERVVLLERLAAQRERILAAFSATQTILDNLEHTPVRLDNQATPRSTARALARTRERTVEGYGLTSREREVLELMSSGATNAQIADQLTVSESTVKSHVKHVLRKLGAANRTEAIARCLRLATPPAGRPFNGMF